MLTSACYSIFLFTLCAFALAGANAAEFIGYRAIKAFLSTEDVCSSDQLKTGLCEYRNESEAIGNRCSCDGSCSVYGDCCVDASRNGERLYECLTVNKDSDPLYVVGKCPSSWTDDDIKIACETDDIQRTSLQTLPVYNSRSVYKNVYCAVCNNATLPDSVQYRIACPRVSSDTAVHLAYETLLNAFVFRTDKDKDVECFIDLPNHNSLPETAKARSCFPTVDDCPIEWPDNTTRNKCQEYTYHLYDSKNMIVYRNYHCAMCNSVAKGDLTCDLPSANKPTLQMLRTESKSHYHVNLVLALSPDTQGLNCSGYFDSELNICYEEICESNSCIDFRDTCGGLINIPVSLATVENGTVTIGGKKFNESEYQLIDDQFIRICINVYHLRQSNEDGSDEIKDLRPVNCRWVTLSSNQTTILEDGSLYDNESGIVYGKEYWARSLDEAGDVAHFTVCKALPREVLMSDPAEVIVTEIALYLSTICLMLHLFVYAMLPKLRNLPGKVLMSISSSLLAGHLVFLIGNTIYEKTPTCYVFSVLLHYFYIAAFAWMNVMAYDIYRIFQNSIPTMKRSNTMFGMYSLYGWLLPAGIVLAGILVDHIGPETYLAPQYARTNCWISNGEAVKAFFVIPVGVILLMNLVLFLMTAYNLHSLQEDTKMARKKDTVRFVLYVKLGAVLGFCWFFGFMMLLTGSKVIVYLYIVFTGLQGTFIFVSFTCKRKVLDMLCNKVRKMSPSNSTTQTAQSA